MAWGRKISLWIAESLIPAEVATCNGTKRFLKSLNVDIKDFPTNRTLLTSALEDVYVMAMETVQKIINIECPTVCCISTDVWTDSHIGLAYVNYNLIYFFEKELKTVLLETAQFEGKKQEKIFARI